jgi:PAS domain S-box-containing protein
LDINLSEDKQIAHLYRYAYVAEANDTWARIAGFEHGNDLIGSRLEVIIPHTIPENIAFLKKMICSRYRLNVYETIEVHKTGVKIHASNTITGIIDNGHLVRVWGTGRDITKQKQIETELMNSREEMQNLAGKLLTAQEEERRLLAREMHDDLTQRLALLAIDLGKLETQSTHLPNSFSQGISKTREDIINISEDVHDISRQLHPSILEDLGLADALKSECAIFSQHEGLPVKYAPQNVHKKIPRDIALCIYRIAQHSLKNIVKHAKATEVSVSVTCDDNTICLKVVDNGVGFIPKQVKGKGGLGLVSMKERVRLIQGNLSIQSKPGKGTVIKVTASL